MSEAQRPYIGIDLGGTNIQVGLVGGEGDLIARTRGKTKAQKGAEAVIDKIGSLVDELLTEAPVDRRDVAALGIGAPGAVEPSTGRVLRAVNLGWENYPLAETLGERTGLRVVVDNDVNVGTWGEYKKGAGRAFDSLMGIFVGTGIGGGLVFNGGLFHGHHRSAGEIGHTVIDADAPLGRRTLENLASRTSVANQIGQLVRASPENVVYRLVEGKMTKIKSRVIADAVAQNDPVTLEVVADAARYVGTAIANAVTLLSLPCVVVGGGLTEALGEPWVEQVREAFRARVFPPTLRDCTILPSELEDNAGIIGAALLARDRLAGEKT